MALVWLALVLALAQVAAIRHAYSHAPGEQASGKSSGKHSGSLAHCDACVAAVALGSGAPPPPPVLFAAGTEQLEHGSAAAVHSLAPQQRPYAIRAPPVLAS